MKDITFQVQVGDAEWDQNIGGWRCSPLTIPGAAVVDVYHKGAKLDDGQYSIDKNLAVIRMSNKPVGAVTVAIKLEQELVSSWWKWGSITLGPVSAIIAALIGAWATTHKSETPVAIATAIPSSAPSIPSVQVLNAASSAVADVGQTPATSQRCPSPPKPEARQPTVFYYVRISQATVPDSDGQLKSSLVKVANEARYRLGGRWDYLEAGVANEYRQVATENNIEKLVPEARWYGLSKQVADGICCYLEGKGWAGTEANIKKTCDVVEQKK